MQVEPRDGGGCIAVFGLAFFVSGLFATLAGSGILPLQNASKGPRLVVVLMGLPFLGIGSVNRRFRARTPPTALIWVNLSMPFSGWA